MRVDMKSPRFSHQITKSFTKSSTGGSTISSNFASFINQSCSNCFKLFHSEEEVDLDNQKLVNATLVLRLLYDLAVDAYDKTTSNAPVPCSLYSRTASVSAGSGNKERPKPLVLNHSFHQDPILVHPGVVVAIFKLIPSIWLPDCTEVRLRLY